MYHFDQCKEQVSGKGKWGALHTVQCSRKAVKDGYCKVHHPDTVAARKEAKEKKAKEKSKAEREYAIRAILLEDEKRNRVKNLESELAAVKAELATVKAELEALRGTK